MQTIAQKLNAAAVAPFMRNIAAFLEGRIFPAVYAALAFLCSLTGMELVFYALTAAAVVFICLFGKSTKPIAVPLVLVVYSTSWKHTPQPPENSDFFLQPWVLGAICVMAAAAVGAMLFRLLLCRGQNRGEKSPLLQGGLLALCAAFLCNGLFSKEYILKDFLFGLLIAASFFAVYFFFTHTYRGKDAAGYFAYTLTLAASVIFLQILYALAFRGVIENGSIVKDLMIAGWGMSNNFGGMLAMFLPAPLYLAYRCKRGWLLYLYSFALLAAVACTLSRSALLTGAVLLAAGTVVLAVAKSPRRTFFRICAAAAVLCAAAAAFLFREQIAELLSVLFERGWSDSNRFAIWKFGLDNFLSAPLFGTGFYIQFYGDFGFDIANWVFPDMYHNILVQVAASCGMFGLLAYTFHLSGVCTLLTRKGGAASLLYLAVFLGISGASLLDNHIFHVFPALVYSLALALWERDTAGGRLPLYDKSPLIGERTIFFRR